MRISVIIITRNREEDVRVTLEAYLKQTYADKEIIVIDNASDDGTREMMHKDYPEIKYLWLPDNFDIRSINIGVEMSTGDIIWRTDSDSNPESEFAFQQAIDIFSKHDDIDIICTEDIEVRRGNQIWEWYPYKVDKVNIPEKGYKSHIFPGTGAAIRRRVFDRIGGFWEFGFEEIDFCTRALVAGFGIRYFPNIRTLHYASLRDRNNANRWIQISKQFMRYNWRYFPFFRAFFRTLAIYAFCIMEAIFSRFSPLAIIEGILAMTTVIFSTYRNERNVVPKNMIKEITLGTSYVKAQTRFFYHRFLSLVNKWKRN